MSTKKICKLKIPAQRLAVIPVCDAVGILEIYSVGLSPALSKPQSSREVSGNLPEQGVPKLEIATPYFHKSMTKDDIWAKCVKQNPKLALAPEAMVALKAFELRLLLDYAFDCGTAQGAALVIVATPEPMIHGQS